MHLPIVCNKSGEWERVQHFHTLWDFLLMMNFLPIALSQIFFRHSYQWYNLVLDVNDSVLLIINIGPMQRMGCCCCNKKITRIDWWDGLDFVCVLCLFWGGIARKYDYANYLCALHLPPAPRAAAFALRAFNIETAQVRNDTEISSPDTPIFQFHRWSLWGKKKSPSSSQP
jgi:hypothetical protein